VYEDCFYFLKIRICGGGGAPPVSTYYGIFYHFIGISPILQKFNTFFDNPRNYSDKQRGTDWKGAHDAYNTIERLGCQGLNAIRFSGRARRVSTYMFDNLTKPPLCKIERTDRQQHAFNVMAVFK